MTCCAKPNLNLQEQFDALIGCATACKADRLEACRLSTLIVRDSARVASLGVLVDTLVGPLVAPAQLSQKRIRAVQGTDDLEQHRASCANWRLLAAQRKCYGMPPCNMSHGHDSPNMVVASVNQNCANGDKEACTEMLSAFFCGHVDSQIREYLYNCYVSGGTCV
jgi:hypothetical protein